MMIGDNNRIGSFVINKIINYGAIMSNDKFKNKYRIPSNRAQWWNYSNNAGYFITICTANKEHIFGEISDTKMQLSEIGKIVETEWLKTIDLRPDMNLTLGEYVIMPNHFHCIIIIGKNKYNTHETTPIVETQCIASQMGIVKTQYTESPPVETQCLASQMGIVKTQYTETPPVETQCLASQMGIVKSQYTESHPVETQGIASLQPMRHQQPNKFGSQSKNLASIIRGFKIGVSTNARKIIPAFAWQTRFYDHVIRDSEEYQRIADYILYNPTNWQNDKFYNN
jgi:REP element-mobilizing transposase RayT